MKPGLRFTLASVLTAAALVLAACGGGDESEILAVEEERQSSRFDAGVAGSSGVPGAPAATAAPPPPMAPTSGEAGAWKAVAPEEGMQFDEDMMEVTASLVAQERLIVRNVSMKLVVEDISASLDAITALASELGGRFVSSDHSIGRPGFISIRVPAEKLDSAILRLRGMAVEVESEVLTSHDVTEEHQDLNAQLRNERAAEEAFAKMLDRAEDVEHALEVQRALNQARGVIERLEGRINLLEETAAFSLISITLEQEPAEMTVDAGADVSTGVGELVRFRATFRPPEEYENYVFTWDFGDGSQPIFSDRTNETEDPDVLVTATVAHEYRDERDSPYFAEVKITATGKLGVAEGEDTTVVSVTQRPVVQVFAGRAVDVEEGEEAVLTGSFTRPEGLTDARYSWDFGDSTAPLEGALGEGATDVESTHVYDHHSPYPFEAVLTITAESDAGSVKGKGSVSVTVTESRGWVIGGWSAGDQLKTAVRTLSGAVQWAGTALIWVAILSPLWAALGVGGGLAFRRVRSRRRR